MKYIDSEKLTAKIDRIINLIKKKSNPNPLGTIDDLLADFEIKMLELVKTAIDEMKQEEPTPQGVEEESNKKGWLDYGLMMSEIGLHRYNAIHRIKEHKERFNPQAVPDLYHVSEYYKAVGAELTCCCLQAYGKDFIFTQDEVREIIDNNVKPCEK